MIFKIFGRDTVGRIRKKIKDGRRERFRELYQRYVLERPGENPIRLIAVEAGLAEKTVYDVMSGRR